MRKLLSLTFLICSASILSCVTPKEQSGETANAGDGFVVIGYVSGFSGEIDETIIDAGKLTHINYAFVDVKDSLAWLTNIATDTINFRRLNNLKK